MILPGKLNLKGVIGTTFDATLLVYPSEYGQYNWGNPEEDITWKATVQYELEQVVVGSDGKAYVAEKVSKGINPVGDVAGNWKKLVPFNLTGCTAEAKIKGETIVLKTGSGITLGGAAGTVAITATPAQTTTIVAAGKTPYSVLITEAGGNVYEYTTGQIAWQLQQHTP